MSWWCTNLVNHEHMELVHLECKRSVPHQATAINQSQLQVGHTSGTLQMFQLGTAQRNPRGILNDTTVYLVQNT